jgi:FKBP-type peptidyl-prolyl cis-trans isomerase FkpA
MFKLFGKKREPKPTPPWVMWALIGAAVFAFLTNSQRAGNEKPTFERTSRYLKDERHFNFKNMQDKIVPSTRALSVHEDAPGEGTPAVCGQEVKVAFTATLDKDTVVDQADKEHPLIFTLGHNAVMPVFEKGVLGIYPGGKRTIETPPMYAYGLEKYKRDDVPEGSQVTFAIELLAATPTVPTNVPYRVFDTAFGSGANINCGDTARAHVTVWGLDGNKLYSTKDEGHLPIVFTPGKREVFFGLEQGIIGMIQGGSRTMIVPPALQKPLGGGAAAVAIPLPKNQTVLVDVEALP